MANSMLTRQAPAALPQPQHRPSPIAAAHRAMTRSATRARQWQEYGLYDESAPERDCITISNEQWLHPGQEVFVHVPTGSHVVVTSFYNRAYDPQSFPQTSIQVFRSFAARSPYFLRVRAACSDQPLRLPDWEDIPDELHAAVLEDTRTTHGAAAYVQAQETLWLFYGLRDAAETGVERVTVTNVVWVQAWDQMSICVPRGSYVDVSRFHAETTEHHRYLRSSIRVAQNFSTHSGATLQLRAPIENLPAFGLRWNGLPAELKHVVLQYIFLSSERIGEERHCTWLEHALLPLLSVASRVHGLYHSVRRAYYELNTFSLCASWPDSRCMVPKQPIRMLIRRLELTVSCTTSGIRKIAELGRLSGWDRAAVKISVDLEAIEGIDLWPIGNSASALAVYTSNAMGQIDQFWNAGLGGADSIHFHCMQGSIFLDDGIVRPHEFGTTLKMRAVQEVRNAIERGLQAKIIVGPYDGLRTNATARI